MSAVLVVTLVAGCLGRSPNVRRFVLGASNSTLASGNGSDSASGSTETMASERAEGVAVLVGPVRLPAYLERNQFASLADDGQIELDEFTRWLGGFEENFLRGISLGLARELGSDRVVAAPSNAPFDFDYRIRLHVDDMIWAGGDGLRVRIRWTLIPEAPSGASRLFVLDERVPATGGGAEQIVRAHDTALLHLVERIAREIGEAPPRP